MPSLKQLTCCIKWSGSGVALTEYDTRYGDGWVETSLAIPEISTPFRIQLTSTGYIAPGIAMFV
ncbi:hypothetical protein MMC13_008341, partial [Lambiella insularis]|nr:hypothetical protein [Lambiella insularis]